MALFSWISLIVILAFLVWSIWNVINALRIGKIVAGRFGGIIDKNSNPQRYWSLIFFWSVISVILLLKILLPLFKELFF